MKIISWWQTWVDQRALQIAKEFWIETWGYAPKNFSTEKWQNSVLKEYWLVDSWLWYSWRTKLNINKSDVTIIVYPNKKFTSPGTEFTKMYCVDNWKKYYVLDDLTIPKIKWYEIYNFVWPRESKLTEKEKDTCKKILKKVISLLK